MSEKIAKTETNQNMGSNGIEIDLLRIWNAVCRKLWMIVLATVIGGIIAFVWTVFLITPQYNSSALFYVNNNVSLGGTSVSISSADISASKSLVDSYLVILQSRGTLNDVIDYAGVDHTYSEIRKMISASDVNDTEIFEVVVTSPDPQEAEQIANAIAYILPKRISSIIEGSSAKVVDYAVVPSTPSSPSLTRNTILGVVLAMVLSTAMIVVREIFDVTIKTEEDITRMCDYPVLASVPDMGTDTKSGSYYGYGQKKARIKDPRQEPVIIGSGISFAASEAYKLLRMKIQYSFTNDSQCRIIAVSSAMAGEGKSVSAANLANTLAQFGAKVLLVDCDMRRPTVAEKLKLRKEVGLSDFLTGTMDVNNLFQYYCASESDAPFYVVSAGPNPPNPVELLSSPKMGALMTTLRSHFNYVILDMPPIGEVSDALAAAHLADGLMLVVRQNYCNTIMLKDALRQFEFVGTKILGVVVNCAEADQKHKYNKYYRYNKYRGYGYYRPTSKKGGNYQKPKGTK